MASARFFRALMTPDSLRGTMLALGAFTLWGLFPIYWKQLVHVGAAEVLAHRVLWSVPFIGAVIVAGRRGPQLVAMLRRPSRLGVLAATSCLISINWGIYIWAVGQDKVVEASMGYFLTPLLNVVLGLVMFRERLHPAQTVAVLIAAGGVAYLFFSRGVAPWVALSLAASFGIYGALRKRAVHDSITGLFVETALMMPLALLYLALATPPDSAGFGSGSPTTDLLLIGAGIITASPLLLFVAAARRLHYSTTGLLFYLTPTMQFLIGVFLYDEPLHRAELVAFVCIWTALALFATHGFVDSRRTSPH